jgi:hypothetical protein
MYIIESARFLLGIESLIKVPSHFLNLLQMKSHLVGEENGKENSGSSWFTKSG